MNSQLDNQALKLFLEWVVEAMEFNPLPAGGELVVNFLIKYSNHLSGESGSETTNDNTPQG